VPALWPGRRLPPLPRFQHAEPDAYHACENARPRAASAQRRPPTFLAESLRF
jgi:hypothetical protein